MVEKINQSAEGAEPVGQLASRGVEWEGLVAHYTAEELAFMHLLPDREAWFIHELKANLGARLSTEG